MMICPHCKNDGTVASIDIAMTVNVVYNGPRIGLAADPFEPLPGDDCTCGACGMTETYSKYVYDEEGNAHPEPQE